MPREPFNRVWATDPLPDQFAEPSESKFQRGHVGGASGELPEASHENWRQNRLDVALQQIERKGALDWHPEAIYAVGAPAIGSDGQRYRSQADDNQGNDPALDDGTYWAPDDANQMSLSEPIDQAPGAETVQQALAAIGALAGDGYQNIAVFDTPGITNWDVPEVLRLGLRKAHVTVIGGGGGGGAGELALSNGMAGGGGGGGGIAIGLVDLSGVGSVNVTVGVGGSGTTSGPGSPGGSSSFGAYMSATGGGSFANSGGSSGTGSGGDFNSGLGPGTARADRSAENTSTTSGSGGGPGGEGRYVPNGEGRNAVGPGGGGGGSNSTSSSGPRMSGSGAPGIVIVRW